MNIISNNCLSGFLYKDFLKQEFGNPFVWSVIDFKSMLYLVQNYDKINFRNYKLVKDKNWNFSIIIDEHVKIQYVHYKFSPTATTIIHNPMIAGEVFYNKIWEYIIAVYDKRLTRMSEKPIFCIMNFNTIFPDAIYTNEELEILSKYENVKILKGYEKMEPFIASKNFYDKMFR